MQYWESEPQQSDNKKEIKGTEIGKEEVKLSVYTDEMIVYIYMQKFLKSPGKKLQELINEVSKVAGNKINIKSVAFFTLTIKHHKQNVNSFF